EATGPYPLARASHRHAAGRPVPWFGRRCCGSDPPRRPGHRRPLSAPPEPRPLPAEARRAVTELSARIAQLSQAKEAAVVAQDFETAARLRAQATDPDPH